MQMDTPSSEIAGQPQSKSVVLTPRTMSDSMRTHHRKRIITLAPNINREALPPLPDISSEALRKQVFTHRSFFARPTGIFEDSPDDPSPDNEMLEHLGDSVLNLVVTGLLREIYPYLRVGPSTKIRALIVGNSTLARISHMYRLNERLYSHPAQQVALRASMNIQADLFEAYVGGLFRDQGLEAVQAWLSPLLTPFIEEAYRLVRIEHGLSPDRPSYAPSNGDINAPTTLSHLSPAPPRVSPSIGHLSLFNQVVQQKSMGIEWVYTDSAGEGTRTTPMWVVRAMVNSECLGRGRGSTKKAAKNEAAKEGLKRMGVEVPQPFMYGL